MKLDLGCGKYLKNGYTGVDWNPQDKNILKADLNEGIPAKDNSVEALFSSHCLEHLKNPYFILDEIWRVCITGAKVEIVLPLFEMTSPDHKTCFYDDWFERNMDFNKFKIMNKITTYKNITDPKLGGDNSFWELTIILEVVK